MDPLTRCVKAKRRYSDISSNDADQELNNNISFNLDNISEESGSILILNDDFNDSQDNKNALKFIEEMTKRKYMRQNDEDFKQICKQCEEEPQLITTDARDNNKLDALLNFYKTDILIDLKQAEDGSNICKDVRFKNTLVEKDSSYRMSVNRVKNDFKMQKNFIVNYHTASAQIDPKSTKKSLEVLSKMHATPKHHKKDTESRIKYSEKMFGDSPILQAKEKVPNEIIKRPIKRIEYQAAKLPKHLNYPCIDKKCYEDVIISPAKPAKSKGVQVNPPKKRMSRKGTVKEYFKTKKDIDSSYSDLAINLPFDNEIAIKKSKSETDINHQLYISDHDYIFNAQQKTAESKINKPKEFNLRCNSGAEISSAVGENLIPNSTASKNVKFYRESLHDMTITEDDYKTWLKKKNWARYSNIESNTSLSTTQLRSVSEVVNHCTPKYQEYPERSNLYLNCGDYQKARSDTCLIFSSFLTEINEALLYKELKILETIIFFSTLNQQRTKPLSASKRITQIIFFLSLYCMWMLFETFYKEPRKWMWNLKS